ncbi:glycolate oxidase subunit GlcE [Flavisphingomonas formosensis]|uniref:glycolate oxidase subunit GlcE n=1 Tax=Flavisphingomonas formosensis TaxID=861534 RepID=UPI0012FA7436|nr:glycolate oxidase subunit GlcE [Sphingomonas formosensis]
MASLRPTTPAELAEAVGAAAASGGRLEIRGGASKAAIGAPREAAILDMRGFTGVVDYDPAELVLTVRAGTPLAEIERMVARQGQMLAFEPWDHGNLFGWPEGRATIGGVIAAGVAGPRRLTAGGARDHLLGFKAVSGRGEAFVGGAKVVKNVTGYDLPKLMAGSWGRLAAIHELSLKVLPRPRMQATMVLEGLEDAAAHAAMARAMGCHAEVSAAAHLPAAVNDGRALTLLRLHGFEPSVTARCAVLPGLLSEHGPVGLMETGEADALWRGIRDVEPLADAETLWRVSVPPAGGCTVAATLAPHGARWFFDWAGGLVWAAFDGDAAVIRGAAERAGGHAMLVRASEAMRAVVSFQHPRAAGVMALERRVRRAFDPTGVFETGRYLDEADAD